MTSLMFGKGFPSNVRPKGQAYLVNVSNGMPTVKKGNGIIATKKGNRVGTILRKNKPS